MIAIHMTTPQSVVSLFKQSVCHEVTYSLKASSTPSLVRGLVSVDFAVRPVYGTASRVSSWSDSFKSCFVPSTVCSSSFVRFFIVLFSSSEYFVFHHGSHLLRFLGVSVRFVKGILFRVGPGNSMRATTAL